MGHEESTQQEITDVQRFTVGVAMLIWSLACAISVGVSISVSYPSFVGFASGAGVLLVVLPLAGAYLLITGIIGIFKVDSDESH
ncbi:MAG: hypothetical protein C4K48_00055 [Candidatus Thorarchaeota archaeon]|nr:MAG: hypothetical protein C4K48_00055 [Candidatus Thorarchaeota archaeon]